MTLSPSYPDQDAAPGAAVAAGKRAGNGRLASDKPRPVGGILSRITIRTRLILLSSALLVILVATNFYLTRKLATNSAGMVETAELLRTIEEANNAQLVFGEVRYWMTYLAVSLLNLSEANAKVARTRMARHLNQLAPRKPERIAAVREELAKFDDLASKAVDEYTADRRVIGNTLLAQARQHSIAIDRLLGSIVAELTGEAVAARDRVVAEATLATRASQIVTAATVLAGALLTFLVLRSISRPLRRLVVAMSGLNAGNTAVEIPAPGSDEMGEMARTLASFRETLGQLRSRTEELGRSEAELSVTFENMGDGVAMFDERLCLASWNGHLKQILDLPEEFLARRPSYREYLGFLATHGEFGDIDVEVELQRYLARAGQQSTTERSRPDGRVVQVRHNPVPGGGFVLIYSDVTERKRPEAETRAARDAAEAALAELRTAQASLIHAEKMASLGQLTAGIAHEIKNPLNFVNNFAGLSVELLDELKETAAPGIAGLDENTRAEIDQTVEMLTGNLKKIAEHGKRADGIVKSMLAHSRGSSGERQSVDLNAVIEEALNLAYHGARAQDQAFNVTLQRDLDPSLARIELVPQDITRVFLNLFGNGFYAANKRRQHAEDAAFRPTLIVATRELGEAVEIRVRDNGIGISPEHRDKLFQPFFTTKPPGEGTGLGLSISYDIVTQEHGGTIAVNSEPGQFTEFTITLPRSRQVSRAVGTA